MKNGLYRRFENSKRRGSDGRQRGSHLGIYCLDERAYITGGVLAVVNEFSTVPKSMAVMIN